jgi:hypothetical protein
VSIGFYSGLLLRVPSYPGRLPASASALGCCSKSSGFFLSCLTILATFRACLLLVRLDFLGSPCSLGSLRSSLSGSPEFLYLALSARSHVPAFCLASFFPANLAPWVFLPFLRKLSLNPSEFIVALTSLPTWSLLFPC